MAFLDSSIVNVAIPKLMATFGVGTDTIEWVSTAYLLSAGVMIPITGFLSDWLGLKKMYIFSLSVFTLGSALCGMSSNEKILIASRIIQAIGGGALMPVTTAFVYRIVAREKVGMALGIRGISMAMAPAMGPALGGYLIDRMDWQVIFTLNIPVGIITIILAILMLPALPPHPAKKFDLPGLIFCAVGCFTLLLALNQGEKDGWSSYFIVMLLTTGVFSLILFVIRELSVETPALDISLLKSITLAASFACTAAVTISMYASIFLIPIFVQDLQGYSPYRAGLLMMPAAVVMGIMTPLAGRLFDRFGARPLCLIGMPIMAYTTYLIAKINLSTTLQHLQLLLALRSLGMGLFMLPITAAGLNTVPQRLMNQATALNSLVRQISGSLGVAYFTYLMTSRTTYHMALNSWNITGTMPALPLFVEKVKWLAAEHGLSFGGTIAGAQKLAMAILAQTARNTSTVQAMDDALLVSSILVILTIPLTFLLKKPRPHVKLDR